MNICSLLKISIVTFLSANCVVFAQTKSTKLLAFEKHLAHPSPNFQWLSATKAKLFRDFSKDPEAAQALQMYVKTTGPILSSLNEMCDKDAEQFAKMLSDQDIYFSSFGMKDLNTLKVNPKHAAAIKKAKPLFQKLQTCLETGMTLDDVGEGTYGFTMAWDFENTLRVPLGIPIDPVTAFAAEESKTPVVSDMVLLMSWDELRQKIIRWESFLYKNLKKPEENPAWIEFDVMKSIYLGESQLDNSRSVNEDGKVNKEWIASLNTFVKTNKDSRLAPQVKALLKKYKATGTF